MPPTTLRITPFAAHACAGLVLAMMTISGSPPAAAQQKCWAGHGGQFYRSIEYCVSSVRAPEGGNTYGPENLVRWEGGPAKAWCEGVEGYGLGETIMIRIENGPAFRRLLVSNGDGTSPEIFANNGRVRTVEITSDTGIKATIDFPDKNEMLPVNIPGMAQKWIQFKIVDVYPGERSPNTCLTLLLADVEYEEELLLREQGLIK
jgi:hypothetical protein